MPRNRDAAPRARGSRWLRHAAAIAVALGVAVTPACSSRDGDAAAAEESAGAGQRQDGGGGASRARTYGSLAELADDSALVVTGTVQGQRSVADLPDTDLQFTLADVAVEGVLRGDVRPGSSVVVRQTPLTGAQALEQGSSYLLYLTRSGLGGERASHYYVTGVTAGIYEADPADVVGDGFHRFDTASGDVLPAEISSADALG